MQHSIINTGDEDSHRAIEDGRGSVVLSQCRVCGQAEGDLEPECPGPRKGPVTTKEAVAKASTRKSHVKINPGQVAAILGVSKTMKRDAVIREMVRRYQGAPSEFEGNVATEYAENFLEQARLQFCDKFKLNIHQHELKKPHKLVSVHPEVVKSSKRPSMGLFYLRIPYGQRDAAEPTSFNASKDVPHHWAQMQVEMFCAGLTWALFHQWSVLSSRSEVVEIDMPWIEQNMQVIEAFYAEYKDACKDKAHLEPLRQKIDNETARKLIAEMDELDLVETNAKARKAEIMGRLKDLAKDKSAIICGRSLTRTDSKGNISYANAIKKLLPDADLEPYRGAPSTTWKLT